MFRQTLQQKPLLCVLALLLLAALACGGAGNPGPENVLVGQWQRDDGKETIEFSTDGSVTIEVLGATMEGKYKLLDDATVQMDISVLDETVAGVFRFSLAEDTLTLTSEDGISATYGRVK